MVAPFTLNKAPAFLLALRPSILFFLPLSVRVRVVKRSLLNFLPPGGFNGFSGLVATESAS